MLKIRDILFFLTGLLTFSNITLIILAFPGPQLLERHSWTKLRIKLIILINVIITAAMFYRLYEIL